MPVPLVAHLLFIALHIRWTSYLLALLVGLTSLIGIRLLAHFHSFFWHWERYRNQQAVTTGDLMRQPKLPHLKIQITTLGTAGSTEVIRQSIQSILSLVYEVPALYGPLLNIEVVTEAPEQKELFEREFAHTPLDVQVFVIPPTYETPNGTKLKARALHYMVELRRQGINYKPGRTFIAHYDEESIIPTEELKKLLYHLAITNKQLLEGPIYYSLKYRSASMLCRAIEANRPIGGFECCTTMEHGLPLHIHGSNLVIDETLENELGWDLGILHGQPFVAEDFIFGIFAYLLRGPTIFGWHGCLMLEQPPLSYRSTFWQRYRWVLGILQGLKAMRTLPQFRNLPLRQRLLLIWRMRYRVLTFAYGLPVGILALGYTLYQSYLLLSNHLFLPLPLPLMLWLTIVGFLWLNTLFIGAWYNLSYTTDLAWQQRWLEIMRVLCLAPLAGIMESAAACWAIGQWALGHHTARWQPLPKTVQAEQQLHTQALEEQDTAIVLSLAEQRLQRIKELRQQRESTAPSRAISRSTTMKRIKGYTAHGKI